MPFGFGGESGAYRLHAHLPPEQTTLHVGAWPTSLPAQLGLVPDRTGPIVVLRTMTDFDLEAGDAHVAHPILIHAELEARLTRERARSAAVLDQIAYMLEVTAPVHVYDERRDLFVLTTQQELTVPPQGVPSERG